MPSVSQPAHGGVLVDLAIDSTHASELRAAGRELPSWTLTPRQLCDLELLGSGALSPLRGFMGEDDYASVCEDMRLSDGTLWPIPIVLDVTDGFAARVGAGTAIALRDQEGVLLGVLHVWSKWRPDRLAEAKAVYGTVDDMHPGVAHLLHRTHDWYLGGSLDVLEPPPHYDFTGLRLTPRQVRGEIERHGWDRVVAFQTRNPMHRAHQELTLRAARDVDAGLLIHPVVGMTKPGDVDHFTRVRCYRALMSSYPPGTAMLSLLPLAMRMAGPREAVWHAIIRKNHGATHFIVGRDHAGPGQDRSGRPFYEPYASQDLLRSHERELGIQMVPFSQMVYVPHHDRYFGLDEVPAGMPTLSISGTQLRQRLATGDELPAWFTPPAVANELRRTTRSIGRRGGTIFFTGLSGAGKSTIANILMAKVLESGGRTVTLLDGDVVRTHLSSELGFSREHRDLNIRRIGFVASEITRHGGLAVCAPIAPYDGTRRQVRRMVEEFGEFVLIHVDTDVEECERRDRKGLYARARAGLIEQFTGISDPYDVPADADLRIDTLTSSPEQAADAIIEHLVRRGLLDEECLSTVTSVDPVAVAG